jgi:hypothetical protein
LLIGAWPGEDQALFLVGRLLADLMSPSPLNRPFDNYSATVMQQHLLFPGKCARCCMRTFRPNQDQADCREYLEQQFLVTPTVFLCIPLAEHNASSITGNIPFFIINLVWRMSRLYWFMVSCGVTLSKVGYGAIPKPGSLDQFASEEWDHFCDQTKQEWNGKEGKV